MNKQTKGVILLVVIGGSLLFWGVAVAAPGVIPSESEETLTLTGTPADHFTDDQRPTFCGTGDAKSNTYVREFKIPTECTQPLSITTDPSGNIWFTETNTGSITKFDPITESFTEYSNPNWPEMTRSMMWGIDYSDGNIWYTDATHNLIWKFSTGDETFHSFSYPESESGTMPQRLQINNGIVITNDFVGNRIVFFDPNQSGDELEYETLASPIPNSVTGAFAIDEDNLWYTNWKPLEGGVLVKYNLQASSIDGVFTLPFGVTTPNGLSIGPDGKIWGTDTASSLFFSFDPTAQQFTKYLTPPPGVSAYGNQTGVVKNPVSRPYWNTFDENGRLWFNEQTSNSIAVFDPSDESIIEYLIPSKNPNWSDCVEDDCGLSQALDFTISGDKVWFTEWVENNIGVIDTTLPLPFEIQVDPKELHLSKGEMATITITLIPKLTVSGESTLTVSTTALFDDIQVLGDLPKINLNEQQTLELTFFVPETALSGQHKVAIALPSEDVTVAKYLTIEITR